MTERLDISVGGTKVGVRVAARPGGGAAGAVLWPSIGEYPVYDSALYGALTSDESRVERFRAAVRALAPGRRVLDIGTGEHLNWARESVSCGASGAVAIEAMAETFRNASANRLAWGLADRVTLLHGESTELEIGPPAEVCVAEVIGSVAGAEGAAAVLADARRRHLVPGGVVVPHRCVTRAAAVNLREVLGGAPVAFAPEAVPYLERIFEWNGAPFDVRLRIGDPDPEALLSTEEEVEVLDFNGDLRAEQERRVRLTVRRPGSVDGVLTWLRIACLPDEEPLDALRDPTSWASVYFPLFDAEVPVERGDTLDLTFRVRTGADGVHPDYHLAATLRTAAGELSATHGSPHRGRGFREHPVHRTLFPA
ncbi:class I SAM-dependent methyltransferase [Streptomyces sp. NRRL S-495]|uniref:class I SAM-dependent methyltransferase n=1 Tax=Streptomyces sp. NRRL S-495 TaxID=1609133 RepID=UPI000696F7DA|nr:class I SAM-dependent methyltransferase [Streptomyces sp. NRRL S-495]